MILFYLLVLSLPFVDHGFFGREIAGLTLEKIIGAGCFVYALAYLPRRRTMPALFASAQAKAFALYVQMAVTSYVSNCRGDYISGLRRHLFVAVLVLHHRHDSCGLARAAGEHRSGSDRVHREWSRCT